MSSTCSVLVVSHDLDGLLLLGAASLTGSLPTMGFITFQAGPCAVSLRRPVPVSRFRPPVSSGTTHLHRFLDTLVALASRQATRGHDLSSHPARRFLTRRFGPFVRARVSAARSPALASSPDRLPEESTCVPGPASCLARPVLTCFDTESPTQTSSTAWLRPRGCTTARNWGSESGASVESACPASLMRVQVLLRLRASSQSRDGCPSGPGSLFVPRRSPVVPSERSESVPVPPVLPASLLASPPGFPWCSEDPGSTEVEWCRSFAGEPDQRVTLVQSPAQPSPSSCRQLGSRSPRLTREGVPWLPESRQHAVTQMVVQPFPLMPSPLVLS